MALLKGNLQGSFNAIHTDNLQYGPNMAPLKGSLQYGLYMAPLKGSLQCGLNMVPLKGSFNAIHLDNLQHGLNIAPLKGSFNATHLDNLQYGLNMAPLKGNLQESLSAVIPKDNLQYSLKYSGTTVCLKPVPCSLRLMVLEHSERRLNPVLPKDSLLNSCNAALH
jgi:hypothetical protein